MDPSELTGELALEPGEVAAELRAEFPELRLVSVTLAARSGRSPRHVRARLRDLSDRFRGAQALALRQSAVPWAYRVFYRHVGLDPDAQRIPVEAAAVERLVHGGFRSRSLLDDALTIALMETGVPIWALDGTQVEGPLTLRPARAGEVLGRYAGAPPLPAGRLLVADATAPLAVLFGELAPGHGVAPATTRMTLFSVQVAGVPSIHVEEAFWTCASILTP